MTGCLFGFFWLCQYHHAITPGSFFLSEEVSVMQLYNHINGNQSRCILQTFNFGESYYNTLTLFAIFTLDRYCCGLLRVLSLRTCVKCLRCHNFMKVVRSTNQRDNISRSAGNPHFQMVTHHFHGRQPKVKGCISENVIGMTTIYLIQNILIYRIGNSLYKMEQFSRCNDMS